MTWLTVIQIVTSILLVIAILLQQRGGGLSTAFGGDGTTAYATRRGLEKYIFWATVVLAALFLGTAFVNLFLF